MERWWHKKHGNSVDLIKRIVEYQTFLNFLNSFEHFVTVYRCNPSSRRYIPVGQFDLVSVDGKLVTAGLPPSSSCVHTRIFYLFKVSVKRPICRERCTALSCFNSDTWDARFFFKHSFTLKLWLSNATNVIQIEGWTARTAQTHGNVHYWTRHNLMQVDKITSKVVNFLLFG